MADQKTVLGWLDGQQHDAAPVVTMSRVTEARGEDGDEAMNVGRVSAPAEF